MINTFTKEDIKNMIYEIRGENIILASDVAKIFEIETKYINRVAKRNINNFEYNNYFQVTKNEYNKICSINQNNLSRCQFVTLNNKENARGNNIKYLPYVFTIEGIKILSEIIKSDKIKEYSKLILEAFNEENNYQIIYKSPEFPEQNIQNMIYEISGKEVMLDEDLAYLYKCKNGTKEVNQAVKNNIEKFPKRFSWVLSDSEYKNLRSKILTSSLNNNYGGRRSNPRVFTEEGIIMLATILKSPIAIEVSINIMDTFIAMRHFLNNNHDILKNIIHLNNKIDNNTKNINILNKRIDSIIKEININKTEKKEYLFIDGEVYDSYSFIIDILKKAQNSIILIDGYADKSILDIIKDLSINIILITKSKSLLKPLDLEKYNKQYNNLKIIYSDIFHDRFIINDNKDIYHLGTSINHAGNKIFAINKLEDKEIKNTLINKVNSIL